MGHEQEEGGKWPYAGTAEAIKALGAKHCVKGVTISFLAVGDSAWCWVPLLWPFGAVLGSSLFNQSLPCWGTGLLGPGAQR